MAGFVVCLYSRWHTYEPNTMIVVAAWKEHNTKNNFPVIPVCRSCANLAVTTNGIGLGQCLQMKFLQNPFMGSLRLRLLCFFYASLIS